MTTNSEAPPAGTFKPKKSVALSGVAAGNTALCTVGRTGNDLHYRGYDILDIADQCEFEEIAHLLVHEVLPNEAQLAAYKAKLRALRDLPAPLRTTLEQLPAASHPMDVLRTGVSALGCLAPEAGEHGAEGARDLADRLLACLGSMLCYWHHFANGGTRIEVQTDDDSIAAHFLYLLHGRKPSQSWVRAMQTSLNLYAEHEFNASTFTARVIAGTGSDLYSCISGAIGALRGPKHGGANEVAFEIQSRVAAAGTRPRMTPNATSAPALRTSRSSSDSATRSIPYRIRATWSSRRLRCVWLAKRTIRGLSRWRSASRPSCRKSRRCFRTSTGSRPCRIT